MSHLSHIAKRMQSLCPALDGWRIRARFVTSAKWTHGDHPAVVIYDEGDLTADIIVRRNWQNWKRRAQYTLAELVAHELGHIIVTPAIERFPKTKRREDAEEVIASTVGRILERAIQYD